MAKGKRGPGRPRKAATKTAKTTAAKPSDVKGIPSEAAFKRVLGKIKNAEKDKNSAVATMGTIVADAVNKDKFDKTALRIFRGLEKMSDRKLAITLAHLEHYVECGGLNERATAQGDMVGTNPPGEADATDAETESDEPAAGMTQAEREATPGFEPGAGNVASLQERRAASAAK